MATAHQKITLSSARDIPFNKLKLSQANVRKTKSGISIEELAESIARRGLIQALHVRPVLDADGKETGVFEVPAGGRRYQAMALLVKQKRLSKTAPVPCVVSKPDSDVLIEEVSLAENVDRAPLHPLDQFRAFQTLREKGMSEEEIAAAFFVSARIVEQRLRLASVSPTLLEVYGDDGMTLEQLMAFTVSEDHERQEQVWRNICDSWQNSPADIRRRLTEKAVKATDKRARFVSVDAYEAAGGLIIRDLFEDDRGGWLQDPTLLDQMVVEKLKAEAEAITTEGWKWIEVSLDFPYGYERGLRTIVGTPTGLTDEEHATREALRNEFDRLELAYRNAEEYPDEVDKRLGEIETALEAFEQRPMVYDPADIAIGGVFISVDYDGSLEIDRGYVRPEDEIPEESEAEDTSDAADEPGGQRTTITLDGQSAVEADAEEEEDTIRPLPDRLLSELTAHRTLALRNAVGENPHVALTLLLHRLVVGAFSSRTGRGCLEASVREVHLPVLDSTLKDTAYAKAIDERDSGWQDDIPLHDDDALWNWLDKLDDASRLALLAHCVSYGINALYEKPSFNSAHGISQSGLKQRLREADRIAVATGLDMVEAGWRPTVETYLGRVTKHRILEAVREAAGESKAQLIDHLKKDNMAKEAERLLTDTGWLPEPLRNPMDVSADIAQATKDSAEEDLPAFLSDDEPAAAVAAE